jgi:hypothetical protein
MSSVWVVYSKGTFTGYSESLGNGRETKDVVSIFTTKDKAINFVSKNRDWYFDQDDELIIEEKPLDCDNSKEKKKESAADFFRNRNRAS